MISAISHLGKPRHRETLSQSRAGKVRASVPRIHCHPGPCILRVHTLQHLPSGSSVPVHKGLARYLIACFLILLSGRPVFSLAGQQKLAQRGLGGGQSQEMRAEGMVTQEVQRHRAARCSGSLGTDSPFLFESQTPLGALGVGSYQVPVNEGQPSPAFQARPPSTFHKGRKCEALRPMRWVVPGCQSIEDALDSRVPHLPFLQEAHLLPGDNQEPQVLVVGSLVP